MTTNDDTLSHQSDDDIVLIGALEVPLWQFNIYYNESEKFLLDLHVEVANAKISGISKTLVRDIHTLAGISNTLGVEAIARLGYALEDWLTSVYDDRDSAPLTTAEIVLLDTACQALASMVERIRAKEPIVDDRIDILALLQEVGTDNHENKRGSASGPVSQSTPIVDDDWFAKEMKSLEESLSLEADPTAGWIVDLDVLSSNIDAAKDSASPSVTQKPTAPAVVSTPIRMEKPVAKLDLVIPLASEARHEIRDYRAYVAPLLPADTVIDAVEESIRDIFIEEATEIFDSLPADIDAWSASQGQDIQHGNKIKRALHTLKGSSRMAGYYRFGTVVHNIESILETSHSVLRQDELPDLVQAVIDALMQELRHIKDSTEPTGLALANFSVPVTPVTTPLSSATSDIAALNPPADVTQSVAIGGVKNATLEDANVNTVLRVPTEKIDVLATQLGRSGTIQLRVETSVSKMNGQIKEMSTNLERLRRLLREVEIQAESQMKSRMDDARREQTKFDPLEFDRFTRLQELTRMTAEAMHDIENSHHEVLRGLSDIHDSMAENNVLAEDMQHAVMSVRTVPVKSLGRRLELLIRQACLETGKQAAFFVDSEAEVDSGILNKVVAPLEHLLRNAIAHGIESPETRLAKGKPPRGSVTLQVRHRGNDTVFKLFDDGAGISRAAVENRAKERGLLAPDASLTQEQANQMIFEPGFSTAATVSALSGRGVGMDVVNDIVSEMGGRVVVNSEEGVGSCFELVVPSYMSVISMAPVQARDLHFAVPSALIQDIIVVRDTIVLSAYESGYLTVNGVDYPFYGLSEASGLDAPEIQRNNRILLASDQQGVVAVHIDQLDADRNLVMKPLCRTIASLPGLLGASVAGDGSPLLVINPVQLRQSVQRKQDQTKKTSGTEQKTKTHSDLTVMVIDDSLTIRRITQKFLSRAGFKVILAVDGLDAIEKINNVGAPDLYLTDIEMPNMDGFQLTEHIRTSVSATTPIVMISSRSIEKYAEHAKSLGVTRSLGKPYQEPELLAIIEELLGLKESTS